jgi:hypothetical protein
MNKLILMDMYEHYKIAIYHICLRQFCWFIVIIAVGWYANAVGVIYLDTADVAIIESMTFITTLCDLTTPLLETSGVFLDGHDT